MKKLILHIGTEKTGTTSIQEFLLKNRDVLRMNGIFMPETPSSSAPNHRKLATACFNSGRIDDSFVDYKIIDFFEWQESTLKIIEDELRSSCLDTHILSSEHFSSRLTTHDEIDRLFNFLSDIYAEIKVIIYFRRQDEYAVSLYSTNLKSGGVGKDIIPSGMLPDRYDYHSICNKWAKVFGRKNIIARQFDRNILKNGSVLSDFCNIAGINENQTKEVQLETNPSLEPLAQEVLRLYNKITITDKSLLTIKSQLVSYLEQNYSGKPRLPQKQFVLDWYSQFEDSNQLLFTEYFREGDSFNDDFSKYPVEWPNVHFTLEQFFKVTLDFSKFLSRKENI